MSELENKPKRKRGRPKKKVVEQESTQTPTTLKRKRGRPKKKVVEQESTQTPTTLKRKRGRPKKKFEDTVNLEQEKPKVVVKKRRRRKKENSPVISVRPIFEENESHIKSIVSAFKSKEKDSKPVKVKPKQNPVDKIQFTKIPRSNVYAKRIKSADPQTDQDGNILWDGKPFSICVASFEHKELLERYLKGIKEQFKDNWKFTTRKIT